MRRSDQRISHQAPTAELSCIELQHVTAVERLHRLWDAAYEEASGSMACNVAKRTVRVSLSEQSASLNGRHGCMRVDHSSVCGARAQEGSGR